MSDTIDDNHLGTRIRELRRLKNLSLRELASRTGLSPASLSAYETGHTLPNERRVLDLAEALEVPIHALHAYDSPPDDSYSPMPQWVSDLDAWSAGPTNPNWRTFEPLELDRVLTVALEHFVDVGYHAASIREIAAGAQLSVPGVYHHYASKHDMLVALLTLALDDLLPRSRGAIEEADGPVEAFANLVECLVLYYTNREKLGLAAASEIRSLEEPAKSNIAAGRRLLQLMLEREAVAAAKAGDFQVDDPRAGARAVASMCIVIPSWYRTEGTMSPAELATQYVSLALGLMRYTG